MQKYTFIKLPKTEEDINVFWFRRDLRLDDNHGLWKALSAGRKVLPLFIFDANILDKLEDRDDARVSFIHDALSEIHDKLKKNGSGLVTAYGEPSRVMEELISRLSVKSVFANEDYEPYARERDEQIKMSLGRKGIGLALFKDQVMLRPGEVLKNDGKPYSVFTPFSRKWKEVLGQDELPEYPSESWMGDFLAFSVETIHSLEEIGFTRSGYDLGDKQPDEELIRNYARDRNTPALDATSRIGPHLRFGTVSARKMVSRGMEFGETWLNELIWREFFMHILWFHPAVVNYAFKPAYDHISWRNAPSDFERWQRGETGFPIVDAGMRELSETGFMHNRVRMITASFLVKHLLIDWRLGEAWFARKLLDYELASNNGNWQWAAGTGCDAAPYFRIFNPWSQQKKFDPNFSYIRKWVPEFETTAYPEPMVEHKYARERCLKAYGTALGKTS